jgi:hypothetical protein
VADDLPFLELQDVPAAADSLELSLVVDPAVAELVVDCMRREVQERALRTAAKYSSFRRTCIVYFRHCMKTVFTTRNA